MQRSSLLLVLVASSLATGSYLRVPRLDGRIVGGVPVTIDQYPHQVSLGKRGKHFCGGSILTPTTVLTAAHCTNRHPVRSLTIRAGATKLDEGGEVVKVKSVKQHPDYNDETIDYDVSVLHLEKPLNLGHSIQLVPQDKEMFTGAEVTVTGWGTLKEGGGQLAKQLQAVNVSIVSDEACKKAYESSRLNITARMICAGVPEGGKDSCQGDSGGPLIHGDKQVGIVSWGYGCARPKYPGVYTKIANLHDWIVEASGVQPFPLPTP